MNRFLRGDAYLVCLGLLVSFFAAGEMVAQTESDATESPLEAVTQFLATGEFTLAIEAAESAPDAATTGAALAAIAGLQQAVGANEAAVDTIAGIADDRIRAQQVGGGGFGGGGRGGGGFGGGGRGGGGQQGGGLGVGGGGQSAAADFDTLIELISTTVDPDTWEEVGGQGTIAGFPTGVLIGAKGLLKRVESKATRPAPVGQAIENNGQRVSISLPRLEKALQLRRAAGLPPTPEMQTLGGMARLESIHVYPATGDLVLTGPPASSPESALHLDDLAVVATAAAGSDGKFGCSINPRQENLKRTQEFLTASSKRSLKPGERPRWLAKLAQQMGRQDVEVFGIPAENSTAQALVVADYHMKLVGMGLEAGPAEMKNYLDCVEDFADDMPPLDVLRWWFTSNFDGVAVNDDQTVYHLLGDAVKVLSENELLDEIGQRIHTGQSNPINKQFAAEFTEHFDELADRYPFYARLRGVFELAVAMAVIFEEDLPSRIEWQPTTLIHDDGYLVAPVQPATEVDSIVGHRVFNQTQIVAGVSGGVSFDPRSVIKHREVLTDDYSVREVHRAAQPINARGRNESWVW